MKTFNELREHVKQCKWHPRAETSLLLLLDRIEERQVGVIESVMTCSTLAGVWHEQERQHRINCSEDELYHELRKNQQPGE